MSLNLVSIVEEIVAVLSWLRTNALIGRLFPQLAGIAEKVAPFVPIAQAVAQTYNDVTAAGSNHVQATEAIAVGLSAIGADAVKIVKDADGNYISVPVNDVTVR